MQSNDTIYLLKECDSGSKMAVSSIDDVLSMVDSKQFRQLLVESKEHHEKLGNEIHELLLQYGSDEKDPNPIAKSMSWLKTNFKTMMNHSDSTIADLMTDGCNMGVKSLNKYLNEYPAADRKVQNICKELITIEEKLCKDLIPYLKA